MLCSQAATTKFQSTLPRGSDPGALCVLPSNIYFNPRSLAGATSMLIIGHSPPAISIHAPSRERLDGNVLVVNHVISIHAPSRERLCPATVCKIVSTISIHAPSRERHARLTKAGTPQHFNPRSLAGATGALQIRWQAAYYFNPRSLAGATICILIRFGSTFPFQSTLPRGSDRCRFCQQIPRRLISIHAPSRERQHFRTRHRILCLFQSTLPRGSDITFPFTFRNFVISIHAPSRERQLYRLLVV